ncbi:DUF4280 domain-containing protein [Apibacter sp. ESL0432]|uniref:PAAR-like protein n=1 Tax=Apibacter sp. ESL0432 TaxID=2704652 RepID=UPI001C69D388|nr:PAAR-like protein [Apibacter sp. ESL0432]QYN49895.1 DUF4280 domain-containing protein [Apibacter sp. ESL0432]
MPDKKPDHLALVVEGACVSCNRGSIPECILKVKHKDDDKYLANQKKIATWLEDDQDHMNFGLCNRSSPQPACTPQISWKDYYQNAEFGKQKPLTEASYGECKYKGKITIKNHGQKVKLSAKIFKKHLRESYDIFMISPKVAASLGNTIPSVSKIDLVSSSVPKQTIPSHREVCFEIGGAVKTITLQATVREKDDASLVNWAYYKGDTQKDRIKTYLEYGSTHQVNLEELPEGKTTIFGYGKVPIGDSTKIIIHRKANKLEEIVVNAKQVSKEKIVELPKNTPAYFTPRYTFPDSEKTKFFMLQGMRWRIKDLNGTILYTNAPGFSADHKNSPLGAQILSGSLMASFRNSGSYVIELEDHNYVPMGMLPNRRMLTVKIKNRSAENIKNLGSDKIRKDGIFHLKVSKIKYNYEGMIGLGNRAFWIVQKDGGKVMRLGLKEELKISVAALVEEFKKQGQPVTDLYGIYKFQAFGEDKDSTAVLGKGPDTAWIEVGKNRLESISGPEKIPVGAEAVYKIQPLMSLQAGETPQWTYPHSVELEWSLSSDCQQAFLRMDRKDKVTFSAQLKGEEVSRRSVKKTVQAEEVFLERALWCYKNGTRRTETGWEEENYFYLSLKGLESVGIKVTIWAEHPNFEPLETFRRQECLIKELDAVLDKKGSCQLSFIVDRESKEKIQTINPDPKVQTQLFFTVEFTSKEPLDLSRISLIHRADGQEVETVHIDGKTLYLILDRREYLKVPAPARITSMCFSNEAADDVQIKTTEYGIKHTVWVHTVGMAKEKLTVVVYKKLGADDWADSYNEKQKSFMVATQAKRYEAEVVGTDGLLSLDFTPERDSNVPSPQVFYIAVFKEEKDANDATVWVELESQLKTVNRDSYEKVFNEEYSQVGIAMPTLEEGQTPTAEQLKKVESGFFHFFNPLYVSDLGNLEDLSSVSLVTVARGKNLMKKRNCYCHRDFTEEEMEQLLIHMNGNTKLWTDGLINDNSVKSLTRELNQMFRRYGINTCIQKITFLAQVNAETGFFKLSQEKPSKYKSSTSFYKGRGLIQLTGNLNKDKTAYDDPGPYENYGKYLADNGYLKKEEKRIFIADPDLISKDLHYAIDSAGWEWSIEKKALSYIRDYGDKEKNAYAKWKRDTFPKGVGKSLNDIALAYEETIEEEKYFWFQSKILNGYPLTHKDKPDPHGWEKRKEGLRKLKTWFKYDKAVCRGGKELELEEEGVLAKMKRLVDNHYEYKQETDQYRTEVSEAGLKFMDCSELVSRYLYELEIGINKAKNEPIYMTTSGMTSEKEFRKLLGNNNIDLVGKEESFKPQRGDIFVWRSPSKGGHTGIVYKYDPQKDLVTILEAIGKFGSADESQNTVANGGFPGNKQTRTSVYKRTSKALVNHEGWIGYFRPKNYTKKL